MKKQTTLLIFLILSLSFLNGCGSGTYPIEDYHSYEGIRLVRWSSGNRLKITFLTRDQYTSNFRNAAVEGFAYWTRGMKNAITFEYLPNNDTENADIIVGFTDWQHADPMPAEFLPGWSEILTEAGGETFQFSDPKPEGIEIGRGKRLILLFNLQNEQEWYRPLIASHEMGHALGIRGHSPFIDDLMNAGKNGEGILTPFPSPRDIATLHLALGF